MLSGIEKNILAELVFAALTISSTGYNNIYSPKWLLKPKCSNGESSQMNMWIETHQNSLVNFIWQRKQKHKQKSSWSQFSCNKGLLATLRVRSLWLVLADPAKLSSYLYNTSLMVWSQLDLFLVMSAHSETSAFTVVNNVLS